MIHTDKPQFLAVWGRIFQHLMRANGADLETASVDSIHSPARSEVTPKLLWPSKSGAVHRLRREDLLVECPRLARFLALP